MLERIGEPEGQFALGRRRAEEHVAITGPRVRLAVRDRGLGLTLIAAEDPATLGLRRGDRGGHRLVGQVRRDLFERGEQRRALLRPVGEDREHLLIRVERVIDDLDGAPVALALASADVPEERVELLVRLLPCQLEAVLLGELDPHRNRVDAEARPVAAGHDGLRDRRRAADALAVEREATTSMSGKATVQIPEVSLTPVRLSIST